MQARLKQTEISVVVKMVGTHGDDENLPDPEEVVAEEGDAPGSSLDEGAGVDSDGDGFDDITSCRAKYGISDDEAVAGDNEFGSPFGTSADGRARERAMNDGLNQDSDPEQAGSNNARAVPASCKDIPNNAPESLQLSRRFTLYKYCSGAVYKGHACRANKGLSRAEIICNLRHHANNIMEPLTDHFAPLGYKIVINSGFRPESGRSDHNIGSAADLAFFYKGARVEGRHLTRIQKIIDQHLKLPYTQMINEADRVIHIACRRNGVNSRVRQYWSKNFGEHNGGSAYRYKVSIEGSPPVK